MSAQQGPINGCEAQRLMAPIHSRMPVISLPEDEDHRLDPALPEPDEIVSLLRPYRSDLLEVKPACAWAIQCHTRAHAA
jgi:putative SOS response-associated peptidase YedK